MSLSSLLKLAMLLSQAKAPSIVLLVGSCGKKKSDRLLKLILHHLCLDPGHLLQELWLARKNDDLHGCEKDEKERKRLEKLQPRVLTLYPKVVLLLACCDKPIFELPIQERFLKLAPQPRTTRNLGSTTCHSHCQRSPRRRCPVPS